MMSSGDLSKAIQDLLNNHGKVLCVVGKIKSELLPSDAEALEKLIESKVTIMQIVNLLRAHNFQVGNTAVTVHRKKQCPCFRNL
jgi:2C-methyl-D-erythritol 2,4-cyclodiphosphate synthase